MPKITPLNLGDVLIRNKKLVWGKESAPSTDASGQFTITVPGLSSIDEFILIPSKSQLLTATGIVYDIEFSISGNTVTVTIKTMDVTAATPSYAILASTALTGIDFHWLAIGDPVA